MTTILTARLKAITLDPQQSVLVVVDTQDAYATLGGYLDLAGFDVPTAYPVIVDIQTAVAAARAAGMLIIWFQNGQGEQYIEAGGPSPPNFHKSNALKTMCKQSQLQGKLLAKDSQDYQLVDELVLQPGDIVLLKPRYSSFFSTSLNNILRNRGVHHLVFTDIATNVCVESMLHDGSFPEYLDVVLEGTTRQAGPEFAQKAVLFNTEAFFGWANDIGTFCGVLSSTPLAHTAQGV